MIEVTKIEDTRRGPEFEGDQFLVSIVDTRDPDESSLLLTSNEAFGLFFALADALGLTPREAKLHLQIHECRKQLADPANRADRHSIGAEIEQLQAELWPVEEGDLG